MLECIRDKFYQHCCLQLIDVVMNKIKEGMFQEISYVDDLIFITEMAGNCRKIFMVGRVHLTVVDSK